MTVNSPAASASLVIFTRVEGLLYERTRAASADAGHPLRCLAGERVPLVLVSGWPAASILEMQREFALAQPFICEDGGALYVPRRWVAQPASVNPDEQDASDWDVFRFSPRSISAAFRLVSAMFLARGHDPLLTVGIGCDVVDYALLASVDIPIVVPTSSRRLPDVLRQLPGVYVTSSPGTAGWSEAVLGITQ